MLQLHMYNNRSILNMKKSSSIFIKLICTLINFSLILFTMFGVRSNWYSAETYLNNLKVDSVIVIQLLFVVLALIRIISFFIRKIDEKRNDDFFRIIHIRFCPLHITRSNNAISCMLFNNSSFVNN